MKVTIYSTATCGFCKMEKKYLDDHKISYIEKHADQDEKIAMELYEKSKQFAVPFTVVEKDNGEEIGILGFDIQKLNHAIGI
jgi:glutaredoxin 3